MEAFETVLKKLLVSDNNVIQEATAELRVLLQRPEALAQLCTLLGSCQDVQVRQYACLLLRKRLTRQRHWAKVGEDFQNSMKQEIVKVLVAERERPVKNAIAQLVGVMARHELPAGRWPALLDFLSQTMTSSCLADRELGSYTLNIVSQSCAQQLEPHAAQLLVVFGQLLAIGDSEAAGEADSLSAVHFYVIQTLTNLTPVLGSDHLTSYQQLLPSVLAAIGRLASSGWDEQRTAEALDILDDLADHELPVLAPHVPAAVQLCLRLAADKQLADQLRSKALHCVEWLARTKKKAITKHRLVEPILQVVVPILSAQTDDDEDDADELEEDSGSLLVACTRLIDGLAINMPPEKLLTPLLEQVGHLLTSEDIYARRAAFLALAMTAEGCSERIRSRYLSPWLDAVCSGIQHPSAVVRNAALFALGQFAEYLQPDISKFASALMPVLFNYLSSITASIQSGAGDTPNCDRVFYALESLCETLDQDVMPYLEPLMQQLLVLMQLPLGNTAPAAAGVRRAQLVELAVSAVAALANAAGPAMLVYFEPVMTALRRFLLTSSTDEGDQRLQIQALDTLGVLAKTLGAEAMLPCSGEMMALGISLVEKHDDPDMRRAAYGLFASVSSVLADQMQPYLEKVVGWMTETLVSIEGVSLQYRNGSDCNGKVLDVLDQLSDAGSENLSATAEDDQNSTDDVTGYSIENSYLAEKEDALNSLRLLAENCPTAFLPHLETCFEEAHRLLTHAQEDVRKSAVDALAQFCIASANLDGLGEGMQQMLSVFVPHMLELVQTDDSCVVVMSALDGYAEVLKQLRNHALKGDGHLQAILTAVKDVLAYKTSCQEQRDDGEEDSEYDEMLIEYAGDVLPCLGHALSTYEFVQVFTQFFPSLLLKTKTTRSDCERSFSVGCLAECVGFVDRQVAHELFPQLLAIFLEAAGQRDVDDLQSNAVFGLGQLVSITELDQCRAQFSTILSVLSTALGTTSSNRTRDNICGAVARLIIADTDSVPMDQVFPVFVSCLPLREDYAENETVFRCLEHLYEMQHPCLAPHLPVLLSCAAAVHNTKQAKEGDTRQLIEQFVASLRRDFPDQLAAVIPTLPEHLAAKLAKIN